MYVCRERAPGVTPQLTRTCTEQRHASNALAVYWTVKAGGVPDSQIILMIADNYACNTRNVHRGTVFDNPSHEVQLYEDIEVDFHGAEVTVENFLAVLSGRHPPGTPRNRRLATDEHSNVLLYMTGHGGDGFLKFRDTTDIGGPDLADAVALMREQGRFNELLFIADTCQAATLFREFNTSGVVAVGSADKGENSYSFQHDSELGNTVSDRFTHKTLDYFRHKRTGSLQDLFSSYTFNALGSNAKWKSWLSRSLHKVPLSDFFSATPRATTAAASDRSVEDALDVVVVAPAHVRAVNMTAWPSASSFQWLQCK